MSASVEELHILGVRSFSPHERSKISFHSPLTLIVGPNGSGKTTIIECLKYATTGDMPAGAKTGAFINDPKSLNEVSVKAQVKLKFKSVDNHEMYCIRNLQLTQKKTKYEMKTLDGVLVLIDSESRKEYTTNSRCSELDVEIPNHLGVSKSILENVIFCHQEESNWPLSEPAILKKKFDEIFSATKFTKALEILKALNKDQLLEIKHSKEKFEFFRSNKEKAEKIVKKVAEIKKEIANHQKKIEFKSSELLKVADESSNLIEKYNRLSQIENEFNSANATLTSLQQQKHELKQNIMSCEFEESSDKLLSLIEQMKQRYEIAKNQSDELIKEKSCLEEKIFCFRDEKTKCATNIGQLEAEVTQYERRLIVKENILEEIEIKYGVRAENFHHALTLANDSIKELSETFRGVESSLLSEIHKLSVGRNAKYESLKLKNDEIHSNNERIASLAQDVGSNFESQQKSLSFLKCNSEKIENEILPNLRVLAFRNDKTAILEGEFRNNAKKIEDLNSILAKFHSDTEERTRISVKNELVEKLFSEYNGISNCIKETKFGVSFENIDCCKINDVQKELNSREKHIIDLQDSLEKESSSYERKTALLKMTEDTIRQKRQKMLNIEQSIRSRDLSAQESKDIKNILENIEKELLDKRKHKAFSENGTFVYSAFKEKISEKHDCPLCECSLNENEIMRLGDKINETLARFPENSIKLGNEIEILEKRKEFLVEMAPFCLEIERLNSEIGILQNDLKSMRDDVEKNGNLVQQLRNDLKVFQNEFNSLTSLKSEMNRMVSIKEEIFTIQKEISLMSELLYNNNEKTIDDINVEMDQLNMERASINRRLDAAAKEQKKASQECLQKETELKEIQKRIATIEKSLEEQIENEKISKTLKSKNEVLEKEIIEINPLIEEISLLLEKKEKELVVLRKEFVEKEVHLKADYDNLMHYKRSLDNLDQELLEYATNHPEEKIEKLKSQIETIDKHLEEYEKKVENISLMLSDSDKMLTETQIYERNVQDNLRYRKVLSEIEVTKQLLFDLDKSRGDFAGYKEQFKKVNDMQTHITAERANLLGELSQMEIQKKSLESDLKDDYNNVELHYKEQMISLKTLEMTHSDLLRYSQALEKAILKYHSVKMEEINKIIQELWMITYKGNDIDTIEIKADGDNVRTSNRSYNYRVVMKKGNTELDMRGRCSAGQKVLASIIIRLALAETFCLHCGMIALDEPTTNLDERNVESLATSLGEIVHLRSIQKNFQLIIITHDENFLKLVKYQGVDDFYRVQKNIHGFSTISKCKIQELQ